MESPDRRNGNLENSLAGVTQPVEDYLLHCWGEGIERQGCLQLERVFIPQARVDLSSVFDLQLHVGERRIAIQGGRNDQRTPGGNGGEDFVEVKRQAAFLPNKE